jgi:hypothetical protein
MQAASLLEALKPILNSEVEVPLSVMASRAAMMGSQINNQVELQVSDGSARREHTLVRIPLFIPVAILSLVFWAAVIDMLTDINGCKRHTLSLPHLMSKAIAPVSFDWHSETTSNTFPRILSRSDMI